MKKSFVVFFLVLAFSLMAQTPASIYDIQYTTDPGPDNTYPSSYNGQVVITSGIVTAVGFKGYADNIYISMPEGGAWKGLYVYSCGDTMLSVGDEVEITGSITEYYGLTELNEVSGINVLSTGNAVPDPVVITTEDLATEEAYENVLVELHDVYVSAEQNDYGEWYVVDTSATPGQMDDGFFYLDSVTPPIVITMSDNWAILRGVVSYSYDEFEMHPRTPDDMIHTVNAHHGIAPVLSSLNGNYPNPFNPSTEISYNLVSAGNVTIDIYNAKGAKIRTLVNQAQTAGSHTVTWNGSDDNGNVLSSGIYFYKMGTDNTNDMKKMVLMK